MHFLTKLSTGIVAASLLISTLSQSAFAISANGNGAFSHVSVSENSETTTNVSQKSNTIAFTNVDSNLNTGGNSSNFNTGPGDNVIVSGDATNIVDVSVRGGSNYASLLNQNCCNHDAYDTNIFGNGAFSRVRVTENNIHTTGVLQESNTVAHTTVDSDLTTGHNKAEFDTGRGDNVIHSGDATNVVAVEVKGGSNEANLSGGCGCEQHHDTNILSNGAFSNTIFHSTTRNYTNLKEQAWLDAGTSVQSGLKTGHNQSNFNTSWWWNGGGSNTVHSGNAMSQFFLTVNGGSNYATL